MTKDSAEYRPLITDPLATEEVGEDESVTRPAFKWQISRRVLIGIIIIELFALLAAGVILLLLWRASEPLHHGVLYSPALKAVENEVKVFHVGFQGDLSPFQIPSSPELDDMWEDLYSFGISRITKDEAARLPNKTHAIPGDDGHYIAELDVFHNLHCLNMIRKALDPDYYTDWRISTTGNHIPERKNATEHVGHCVDWIRQSIMCHADTSVIVWQWEDWAGKSIVKGDIAHTCRKFPAIQDWAKERVLAGQYNPTVQINDGIVIPVLHSNDI